MITTGIYKVADVIKPYYEILQCPTYEEVLRICELAGRNCYKSESRIGDDSAEPFLRGIIKRGHETILEHVLCTFRFVTSRGVTHELVRHRLVAFSQESTRYVDYGGRRMCFIQPAWIDDKQLQNVIQTLKCVRNGEYDVHIDSNSEGYAAYKWLIAMEEAEKHYYVLRDQGVSPQFARGVLPQDVKTDIVWSCNLRQLRHMFKLRALHKTGQAHPDIAALFVPLLEEMKTRLPVFFEDLIV